MFTLKNIYVGFFALLCSVSLQAQDTAKARPFICGIGADYYPEFPGGERALMEFIQKNIRYPVGEFDSISGKVIVSFIIDEKGSISDIKLIKKLLPAFDNEAIRVVNMLPCFKPYHLSGKSIRTSFYIPIVFKLE